MKYQNYIVMSYYKSLSVFTILCLLYSCNSSNFENKTNKTQRDYFPLQIGKYSVYKYDTILYRGAIRDTFSGLMKREISDTFIDNNRDTLYKLNIYVKKDSMDDFELSRVETINANNDKIIETDNGLPFIKMAFPLVENKRWEGNKLFDNSEEIIENVHKEMVVLIPKYKKWKCTPTSIDEPMTINGETYDNVTIINHISEDTFKIYINHLDEYYAKDVGLVKKEMVFLYRKNSTENPIVLDADNGFILHLEIIEHN